MNYPKRQITKPLRYQTTSSSDEAPTTSRTTVPSVGNMEEDIRDLRRVLQENSSQNIHQDVTPNVTHYVPQQSQTEYVQLQTSTHIQPYAASHIPSSTYTQHPTFLSNDNHYVNVHTDTNVFRTEFQNQGTAWDERRSAESQDIQNNRNDAENR